MSVEKENVKNCKMTKNCYHDDIDMKYNVLYMPIPASSSRECTS